MMGFRLVAYKTPQVAKIFLLDAKLLWFSL